MFTRYYTKRSRRGFKKYATFYEYHGGFYPYEDPADYVKITIRGTVIA